MKLYELLECYIGDVVLYGFSCDEGYVKLYDGYSTGVPSKFMDFSISQIGISCLTNLDIVLI